MTEHDHNAIGRTVIDFKDSDLKLSCARLRAEQLCDRMDSSVKQLRAVLDGKAVSGGNPLPDAVDCMDAIEAAQKRRDSLLQRLQGFGLGEVLKS